MSHQAGNPSQRDHATFRDQRLLVPGALPVPFPLLFHSFHNALVYCSDDRVHRVDRAHRKRGSTPAIQLSLPASDLGLLTPTMLAQ